MATEGAHSRRVLILGFALFTLPIGAAIAGELAKVYHAPASDVMTLPRYCWAQYRLEIPDTPEFTISRDLCGVGTNHMCDGLLQVSRAKKQWSDAAARNGLLHDARGSFQYTLTAIRDYPNCPIRGDAEKGLADVNQLMLMLKH
jgi:hypothetical protein